MATITKRRWETSKGEPREAWVLAYTDKKGKRHREQFELKRAADDRRIEVEAKLKDGQYRPDGKTITVTDAVAAYLKDLERRLERDQSITRHYYEDTESQLRNYVLGDSDQVARPKGRRKVSFSEGIGHIKLSELSTRAVTQLREDMRDNGAGIVTTRRVLGSLNRTLKFAKERDWISTNPAEDVHVKGSRAERPKKITPPTKRTLSKLIEAAPPTLATKITFAASTGLRASEQWALTWDDVDFEAATLSVERRIDAHGKVDVTKSEAGNRTIPLASAIISLLKEHKSAATKSEPDDLVFPNSAGGHIYHRNHMKREWRPLLAGLKLTDASIKTYGWHALRHFAISTWIEAELKPKTIQTFAGHSTLALTMDRYGHMFPADEHHNAMNKIAETIFAPKPVNDA